MDRRLFLAGGGSALAVGALQGCGGGGAADATAEPAGALDGDMTAQSKRRTTPSTSYAAPTNPKARVVVVGGGMAGVTAAKYLRMWGDQVDVTLVDRSPTYTSCILSSLVLTGQRSLSSLQYGYDALRSKYGAKTVFGEVAAIDPVTTTVRMASGQTLAADRIVLAPGIDFDATPGLTDPNAMPHAWKAGPQTTVLAAQLKAMPSSGVFVLTIPKTPYRCPPGPYERACLIADWVRKYKPQGKVIVLDANPNFVVEVDNFTAAFMMLGIDYRPNHMVTGVDQASRTLYTVNPLNGTTNTPVRGDVVNLIPPQRAPALVANTGLANGQGNKFAAVDVLSYESTAAPRIHVIGDASATTMPKAGHVANQEAKVMADAMARIFAGGSPDPAPVTTSACFSTITMTQASWLHALYQYDPTSRTMKLANGAALPDASAGWSGDNFSDMTKWFGALMADTFA